MYSSSPQSVWSMPSLRHRFSKLTGSGLERRHGVDVASLLNKLCRSGEFAGLCAGVDVFDDAEESSGELLLYKLL